MSELKFPRETWRVVFGPVLGAALVAACGAPSPNGEAASPLEPQLLLAAAQSTDSDGYQLARSPYGHYLAGRHADRQRDLSIATDFLLRALELDPDNLQILARAFALAAGDGRNEEAVELAQRLIKARPGYATARLVLMVDAVVRKDYQAAQAQIDAMPSDGLAQVVSTLSSAWVKLGDGQKDEALQQLSGLEKVRGFEAIHLMQQALLHDVTQDAVAAEAAYDQARETAVRPWLRLTVLAGNAYERFGQLEKASAVYGEVLARTPESTFFDAMISRLGTETPKPEVSNARDGLAEALFSLASLLGQERSEDMALIYTHLALRLRPEFDAAQVLKAEILQQQNRGEEAIAAYEAVPEDSAFHWSVQLLIAEELGRLKRVDEAVARFEEMAEADPNRFEPLYRMGNLLRAEERFQEAVVAYDRAFARIGEPEARHWSLLYFRGIALERTDNWDKAEADFLKALEFEPEQPYVMNYLAYSWVEQQAHLERAQEMLTRAVELRPDDGYIVDSLGWVYFKVGKFENAVKYLERAVELRPHDPVINDHLGDAYWRVGREAEARFQWRRALSFEPEQDLVPEIEAKLDTGLGAVSEQSNI